MYLIHNKSIYKAAFAINLCYVNKVLKAKLQ